MKRFLFIAILTVLSYSLTPAGFAIGGSIASHPASPTAGQKVKLRYVTPVTTNVKWSFGDDTSACNAAASVFTHVFTDPGTYTIRAWDTFCDDGAAPTATKTIIVDGSAPEESAFEILSGQLLFKNGTTAVTVHKNEKGLRAKVTLQGEGSGRARLQWLLDGQPFSTQVKKVDFSRQRNVTIELNRDLPTQIPGSSHTVSLRIKDPRSPKLKIADISYGVDRPVFGASAGFGISYIELRFKNRSAYMNVEKDLRNFKAYADFKCEGSGTLQVQWLVDGKPFFIQSKAVNFAETVTIDSGRNLPTLVNGSHTVSIRLLSPQTRLRIPVIKYLVGGKDEAARLEYDVAIKFGSYQDNFGKLNVFSGNTLQAKQGEHLVMNGKVINKGKEAIPKGFMQTYINAKLVATQAIKLIPPGGLIPFSTSLQFPPEVQKSQIEFRFTDKLGGLVVMKKLHLLADKKTDSPPAKALMPDKSKARIIHFSTVLQNVLSTAPSFEVYLLAENVKSGKICIPSYITMTVNGKTTAVETEHCIDVKAKPDGSVDQFITIPTTKKSSEGYRIIHSKYTGSKKGRKQFRGKTSTTKSYMVELRAILSHAKIEQEVDTTADAYQRITTNPNSSHGGKKPEIKYFKYSHINDGRPTIRNDGITNPEFVVSINFGLHNYDYYKISHNNVYWNDWEKHEREGKEKSNSPGGLSSPSTHWVRNFDYLELSAYNSNGVTRSHIIINENLKDINLFQFANKMNDSGCVKKITDDSGKNIIVPRIKGKGRRVNKEWDSERNMMVSRTTYPDCSQFKEQYEEYLKITAPNAKPEIVFFKAFKSDVNTTLPGAGRDLLVAVRDAITGRLQHDTTLELFNDKTKKKLQTVTLKRGDSFSMEEGYYNKNHKSNSTHTFFVIPDGHITTYKLVATNKNGSTSAKEIVVLPTYNRKPEIEYFEILRGKSPIKSGDKIKIKYKLKNGSGIAEIIDPLRHKVIDRIRVDKDGTSSGIFEYTVNASRVFELVVKNAAGETVRKRVRIHIANVYNVPGQKPYKPMFHSSVTTDKKIVKPGETFTIEARYAAADEANIYWEGTGSIVASLPVFEPGTIGTGQATITLPVNTTSKNVRYLIELSNSTGTTKTFITIGVDLSKKPVQQKGLSDEKFAPGTSGKVGVFDHDAIPQMNSGLQLRNNKFYSDPTYIKKGRSITLGWEISAAVSATWWQKGSTKKTAISLDRKGNTKGSVVLIPERTSQYILEVKDKDSKSHMYTAYVTVEQPKGTYLGKPVNGGFSLSKTKLTEGETCTVSYKFKDADVANLIYYDKQKSSDLIFARLAVGAQIGSFTKGSATLKVTSDMGKIGLLLWNSNGQIIERKTIEVVSGGKQSDSSQKQKNGSVNNKAKSATMANPTPGMGGIQRTMTLDKVLKNKDQETVKLNGKMKNVSYAGKPAVVDFKVTPTIKAGDPCYATYEFRFTESAYILNEQSRKKKDIKIVRPVTLQNPTKGTLTFYPKQNTTYTLVVKNPNGQFSFSEKVIVSGGKSSP